MFPVNPLIGSKTVATQEYADNKASDAEQNAKDASLPITGGDITADSPEINLITNSNGEGVASISVQQHNLKGGYVQYDSDSDNFEIGTQDGAQEQKYPIFSTKFDSNTVDFIKTIKQDGKTVAT